MVQDNERNSFRWVREASCVQRTHLLAFARVTRARRSAVARHGE